METINPVSKVIQYKTLACGDLVEVPFECFTGLSGFDEADRCEVSVTVSDTKILVTYPESLEYIGNTVTAGSYDDNTRHITVGDFSTGDCIKGMFRFRVLDACKIPTVVSFKIYDEEGCLQSQLQTFTINADFTQKDFDKFFNTGLSCEVPLTK